MEKQISIFSAPPERIAWHLYVDGASRGNPGQAGAGIYIRTSDKKVILQKGFHLGNKTNNQAEYLALALALFLLHEKLPTPSEKASLHLIIHSDSLLLVKQLQGLYAIKNPVLKEMNTCVHHLLRSFSYDIKHVFREANTAADKLANDGINKKNKVPESFYQQLYHHCPTLESISL